jgi:Protein of unknown function (DUF2752)
VTTRSNLTRAWLQLAVFGVGLGLLTLQPYSVCPFAVVLGLPCPGCGITRSAIAMAQGDLAGAWHFHPLGPVLSGVALGLATLRLLRCRWRTQITTYQWSSAPAYVWWGLLAVVMAVWLARFGGTFGGPAEVHSPFEALQTLNRK